MEPGLISNFIRFPTAKAVWDAIATTYFDGTDTSQVYDLKRKVARLRQAQGSIEMYYNNLQGLWREIDFRRPNPMTCESDIQKFNLITQEDRVYTFLDGLDDRLDKVRSDVLQIKPFPTVEQAYAFVRREDIRQTVMKNKPVDISTGTVLASKGGLRQSGGQSRSNQPHSLKLMSHAGGDHTAGQKTSSPNMKFGQSGNMPSKLKSQSEGEGCTHCGNAKHTHETCFKLHGYPDWWDEYKAKKPREAASKTGSGRAAIAHAEPQLSLLPQLESSNVQAQNYGSSTRNSGNLGLSLISAAERDYDGWIIDSGATDHMTYDPNDFTNSTPPRRTNIANANGVTYPVTGAGTVALSPSLSLSHTLLVPSLSNKLMSIGQVTEELDCCALIYPQFCLLQDILTKEIIGRGTKKGGLYYMDDFSTGRANHMRHSSGAKYKQIVLWHRRLGHPSFNYLKHLLPDLFSDFDVSELKCDTCILAKSHRVSYPSSSNKNGTPFALIHSDVWGPSPISTLHGIRWFVTFVDDCTRMTWLYVMKHKHDVFNIFQMFHTLIQTQFSAKIRILRSDNGGEYVNQEFNRYFQTHGIVHETTCPQTPQQNGVAERKNRHILETARALLIGSHVPRHFWADAVVTAVYLMNRMPSRVLNFQTPLQVLSTHGPLPSIMMLPPRVFGCVAFVHLHKNQRTKLDPCALRCIFLGYATHQKGYRCYNPSTKRTYVTMDVAFLESETFFPAPTSNSPLQREMCSQEQNWNSLFTLDSYFDSQQNHDASVESNDNVVENHDASIGPIDNPVEIHEASAESSDNVIEGNNLEDLEEPPSTVPNDQSLENTLEVSSPNNHVNMINTPSGYNLPFRKNRGQPPDRYSPNYEAKRSKYPIANHVSSQRLSDPLKAFVYQLSSDHIPTKIEEALNDPKWVQAIKEEMKSLQDNKTWNLVPLPKEKKIVGCKWVFSIKHKADGSIERYKARLVAKGYTQTYGIDYQETFSPVAKLNTVRVLLSLAANLDWPLHQFDVKNAFLHGNLNEEVYMDIPPGYIVPSQAKVVCKLQKALYGLKQSPRAWFGRFNTAMKKFGFKQSHSDHTLFLKHRNRKVTALIIYVDDMIITGDDKEEISKLQKLLATEF
jgi:transposase InsO family protein